MAIEDPELECGAFHSKSYKCPKQGCPGVGKCGIAAEASDPTLHKLVGGYVRYKSLGNANAPTELQMAALRDCGAEPLLPDLVLSLDKVQYDLIKLTQEKQEREQEYERKKREQMERRKQLARKM